MRTPILWAWISVITLGVISGGAARAADTPTNEVAALKAEVERLKGMVPSQSHAMMDVEYHFSNLWFAGEKKNWRLADFYVDELRSHLRWAVRIIPVRKDAQGHEIRLTEVLDPIEKTSLTGLGAAVKAKDSELFNRAYRQMMDSCYACHVATGKPYLRLQIPQQPVARAIDFEPGPE